MQPVCQGLKAHTLLQAERHSVLSHHKTGCTRRRHATSACDEAVELSLVIRLNMDLNKLLLRSTFPVLEKDLDGLSSVII